MPVGDYERCPRFVKVLLKSLIGELSIYGECYDMTRQLHIAQGQCDKKTKSMIRNTKISNYNF